MKLCPQGTPKMAETDVWPAEAGLFTPNDFEEYRQPTQRALQNLFSKFYKKNFNGEERVLEIGSGTGFFYRNLPKEHLGEWIQMEPQFAFLQEAQRKLPERKYVSGSAYALPFPDESFDVVCGYSSFDVLQDLEKAVQEAERVLKRGGLFFHMLDLGVNTDVIQNDFREKRIPLMMSRVHTSPYFPGMPSNADWDIRYIPEEKLPSFLAEAGMSPEEMRQCQEIRGDFAYGAFKNKRGITDENSFPLLTQYHQLFRCHSLKLDAEAYFYEKFTQSLTRHFGKKSISRKKLVGFYRGERTAQQQQEFPGCFVFERNGGIFQPGLCLITQFLDYKIYTKMENKSSLYARLFQPGCYERVTLSLIMARKML